MSSGSKSSVGPRPSRMGNLVCRRDSRRAQERRDKTRVRRGRTSAALAAAALTFPCPRSAGGHSRGENRRGKGCLRTARCGQERKKRRRALYGALGNQLRQDTFDRIELSLDLRHAFELHAQLFSHNVEFTLDGGEELERMAQIQRQLD